MNRREIREIERPSIRSFIENHRALLSGRVLDYGCWHSPYKNLVSGEYVPWDVGWDFPEGTFDAIICTQVIQYVPNPRETIKLFHSLLNSGGKLLLTYPTTWEELPDAPDGSDLWRFTKRGMETLLLSADFTILEHERRGEIQMEDFSLALGYGAVCSK